MAVVVAVKKEYTTIPAPEDRRPSIWVFYVGSLYYWLHLGFLAHSLAHFIGGGAEVLSP